jgi:hypothetical protein
MRFSEGVAIIGLIGLAACVETKTSSSDSAAAANAIQDSIANAVDTAGDSTSVAPSSPSPGASTKTPSTTGQTREGNPTARPPQRGDPMPPMAGETNSRNGPMTPADTLLRDSASGPRFRINSKGKVTPIKK